MEPDLSSRIEALRPSLLRLAQLQLRNAHWAEDAVSETVLAALEGAARFDGRAQLKTWLISILRHKVIDQLRLRQREACLGDDDDGDTDIDDLVFAADGHFRAMPQVWSQPHEALQQRQFLAVLEACMERLPERLGRVFLMREWLELDSSAICDELAISPANLWTMLSRARMRLRECLQLDWFGNTLGSRP